MGITITVEELKAGKISEIINEIIVRRTEPILIQYANSYKENPKGFITDFLNKTSTKYIACLIVFACKKNGLLKELEGQKDFTTWANKQPLEEKWKPVLAKFLLVIWGVTKK